MGANLWLRSVWRVGLYQASNRRGGSQHRAQEGKGRDLETNQSRLIAAAGRRDASEQFHIIAFFFLALKKKRPQHSATQQRDDIIVGKFMTKATRALLSSLRRVFNPSLSYASNFQSRHSSTLLPTRRHRAGVSWIARRTR